MSFEAWRYEPPSIAGQSAGTWKHKVYELIKVLCTETGSAEFSRQEFQKRFLSQLQEQYPTNNTVEFTIDRNMQVLRDDDLIEFMGNGMYRWLDFDAKDDLGLEHETPSEPAPIAKPYGIANILEDGCFLDEQEISQSTCDIKTKKEHRASRGSRHRKNLAGQTSGIRTSRIQNRRTGTSSPVPPEFILQRISFVVGVLLVEKAVFN